MKKYIFLFFVLWSFNMIAMEASDIETETNNISSIETIPDELLVFIVEIGAIESLFSTNDYMGYLIEDLGHAFNAILNYFGNIELVNKRFKKCTNFLVHFLGRLNLNKEQLDDEQISSFDDLVPINRIIPFAKLFCVNHFLETYRQIINDKRQIESMPFCKEFSLDDEWRFKYIFGANDKFIDRKKWNKIIKLISKGANLNLPFKMHSSTYKRGRFIHREDEASLLCIAIQSKDQIHSISFIQLFIDEDYAKSMKKLSSMVDWKDIIRFLIFYRADVNLADSSGQTPLLLALKNRDYDLAKSLLNHGADPKIRDKKGRTSLMYALRYCEYFKKLIESGLLDLLLDQKIDVNAQDIKGNTALRSAIFNEEGELIIEYLINHGIKLNDLINIGFSRKRSALGWAVYFHKVKLIPILLSAGSSIDCKDSKGQSVIEYAREIAKKRPWIDENRLILKMLEAKEKENLELGGIGFCSIC